MRIPLFAGDRPGPQLTTRPLSLGCLIFSQMEQIDFTGPFKVLVKVDETAPWLSDDLNRKIQLRDVYIPSVPFGMDALERRELRPALRKYIENADQKQSHALT
jgi:hypothetical protein